MYNWQTKFTRYDDGTEFANTEWNSAYIYDGSNNYWSNQSLAVEFNVLSVTGTDGDCRFYLSAGSNVSVNIRATGVHLFKIEDGTMKHFIDGTEAVEDARTYDNTVSTFQIYLANTNSSKVLKFRDMQIYPI